MSNLNTKYLNLDLRSPILMGSSPLTGTLENLRKAEDNGVGAVVLRSLFEELIVNEARSAVESASDYLNFSDAENFLEGASKNFFIDKYLRLVQDAKKSLDIPVIASICCNTHGTWVDYAQRFEACGADALELNYFILASDSSVTGQQVDKTYMNLVKAARKAVGIPLVLKIGVQFSSLSHMIHAFASTGVDGLVLFNHFVRPDIDLENVQVETRIVPRGMADYSETLRWIALMSAETDVDLCASTGISDSSVVLKMILAGARCAQLTSAVYQHGFGVISTMNNEISQWMDSHGYTGIDQFRGLLAQERMKHPENWERAQYMKIKS
ncbi:MAG: dihydroorotate dehydrogenase-like protein [Sphaerochaetaceae bacterium]|jgi:dihydroorotate dehydrogenase (fumarate)|nr:dihydroorotate dehydrogenase-like protein [Sphaerochaetaceae bacterium]NLY07006.1 dihydroorotate dehydrogenase-like protein [Spirochaetales bacterium]